MFALVPFLFHVLVETVIRRSIHVDDVHDKEQSFAQIRRTPFGNGAGLDIEIAGLVRRSIDSGKGDKRIFYMESWNITDLGNKKGSS